jgi:hypothetical protein
MAPTSASAIAAAFYKLTEVETILNLDYQTIRRLVRADILVASGRGKGCLISAKSVQALINWMEQGGDKWEAPKMRNSQPDVQAAPVARAVSGRKKKLDAGGTQSASTASNINTGRLTSKPPLRVLNSLKLNLTRE